MRLGGKVIWVFALGFGIGQAQANTSLAVLVYNYAHVPAAKLAAAEVFAARSYRAAGIELTWVECATSEADGERFVACEQATTDRRLFLKILPEPMATRIARFRGSGEAIGIAIASYAFVFYQRVQERAGVWGLPEDVVLGRTIAHELGHVLLGENSHSRSGLMQPHFRAQDFSLESGQFLFDPQQAKRLSLYSQ